MGGPNLEIFKFGMYIMFPIGWMYYFGTNLENRFNVPNFWPNPESTYKIPFDRQEIEQELEIKRAKRLLRREQRLQYERPLGTSKGGPDESTNAESRAGLASLWKAWEVLDREGHDGQRRRTVLGDGENSREF